MNESARVVQEELTICDLWLKTGLWWNEALEHVDSTAANSIYLPSTIQHACGDREAVRVR